MSEEIKEILDKLNKTADNHLFVICSSQKELDEIPKYTSNFLSVNDRQAKLLLNYITNLQQKVEQLEKENEATLKNYGNLVKEWNQLENIRKEAIKYVQEKADYPISYYHCLNDLLNILNKGSEE